MTAYYNEHEPYAAQWLRNLIAAGHIAKGDVDERSIEDVTPGDLAGYTQCHFFAGVGVWSYALRKAGWPDDRPVWTGSCPCQPFSAAGKGAAFADERHLWPAFFHLIEKCRPPEIFGEQVASKDADPWIDLVQDDLEGLDYAFGAVPFPSAGVGAPHIRDRLYWMAYADSRKRDGVAVLRGLEPDWKDTGRAKGCCEPGSCGDVCRLADPEKLRWEGEPLRTGGRLPALGASDFSSAGGLANPDSCIGRQGSAFDAGRHTGGHEESRPGSSCGQLSCIGRPGPTNGFWRDADWLGCTDGKWRPVEPGTFPLAHGSPARVGRLRAYGNAINAEAAEAFVRAYLGS